MTKEQTEQFVDDVAARLFEHFDSVQIMCSWSEDGYTKSINRGCGNYYARLGMAHDFISRDQSQTAAHEIAEAIEGTE